MALRIIYYVVQKVGRYAGKIDNNELNVCTYIPVIFLVKLKFMDFSNFPLQLFTL